MTCDDRESAMVRLRFEMLTRCSSSWSPTLVCLVFSSLPGAALAQAGSPFDTGAQSLLTFALAIAAPIAALIIIGVCIAAATSLISWGAVARTIAGIAGIFGAVQIVAWIRGMFGV